MLRSVRRQIMYIFIVVTVIPVLVVGGYRRLCVEKADEGAV